MAEFTHHDLRKAREARTWPRWKLAQEIGISEDTLERWETGKSLPSPDDVDQIGEAVGDKTIWHRWMRSNCTSYRKRYSEAPDLVLPVAISKVNLEALDMVRMYEELMRDAIDGTLDSPELRKKFETAGKSLMAAMQDALSKI